MHLLCFWFISENWVQANSISIALADSNSVSPETAGEGMFIFRLLPITPKMNKIAGLQKMPEINKIICLLRIGHHCSFPAKPLCEIRWKIADFPTIFSLAFFFLTTQNLWRYIRKNKRLYKLLAPFISLKGRDTDKH